MRALFKPEDADKLIVRDADINESSLVSRFLDIINNGGSLEVTPTYNGNYEVNGMLFSATSEEPVKDPIYIHINPSLWYQQHLLDIYFEPMASNKNYTCFKVNDTVWNEVKNILQDTLGATDISITSNGYLNAYIEEPIVEKIEITLPAGFLQFVSEEGNTNILNDEISFTITGE